MIEQSYSTGLVVLSVVIAILASYTALDLSGRIFASAGRARALWLLGVALAMGLGIWSMHFVGMLALTLPIDVAYDLRYVAASMVFAIGAAAFALWIAVRPSVRQLDLAMAAVVMGIAIAGMHYIGMAGMEMTARLQYDISLFWLSIVVAIAVSWVALFITRRLRTGDTKRVRLARGAASIMMGCAVAGMHYTGMAAAQFQPMSEPQAVRAPGLPPSFLAGLIAVASVLLVGLALIAAMVDRLMRSRAVEAQLRAEKEAAVETNRAKSEFLSNMSHELRTPLNSIIGFSNIILKNKGENLRPADITHLTRIVANGTHLLRVINGVLDLSKIEAGRVELEMGWVDMALLVRETLDEMSSHAEAHRVRLVTEVPPDTELLYADAARLKQIIINLVSNAVRFAEGGTVTLRVAVDERTRRPTHFDVIDTGIGIPKDRLSAIFEAFKQADASTSRQYGGTGLGLTISRSLAELMGWTIGVESEVGVGSRFTVTMRRRESAEQQAPAGLHVEESREAGPLPGAERSAARSYLVLVIDDDADARALLQYELEELQCDVIVASNADAGIALARKVRPDLITLDVMMPGTDGLMALHALRADEDLAHIPVVIISGVGQEKPSRDAGAADYIEKPISREKLAHLIPVRGGETGDGTEGWVFRRVSREG